MQQHSTGGKAQTGAPMTIEQDIKVAMHDGGRQGLAP